MDQDSDCWDNLLGRIKANGSRLMSYVKKGVFMKNEVVLKTFINMYEAQMAKGLLDEKGIVSMLSDEDIGGFQPGMIIGETIKLMVNEEDLERAREVIKVSEIVVQ